MIAVDWHDTREMRFELPPDLPDHRTPKGKRPLRPRWMRVEFSLHQPSGRTYIHVELAGTKIENDATYGRSSIGQTSRRSFGTPWGINRPDSTLATFDELGLPEWARPYIEDNWPQWWPTEEKAA